MTGFVHDLDRPARMFIGARPVSGSAPVSRAFGVRVAGDHVIIEHPLRPADVSDDRIVGGLVPLMEAGLLVGRTDFEQAFVAVVESCGPGAEAAWRAFYRNSVSALRTGAAAFSPVHARARSLLRGLQVLEVGSCFGLFALQCAQDGYRVFATDIDPGALAFVDDAAREFGLSIDTRPGDACDLPFATDSVDTVTLIHLLEHLPAAAVPTAIAEALRVARRRVIIAVPFENEPRVYFGHQQSLSEADLHIWAAPWSDSHTSAVFADHGGWLVLDAH